VQGWDDEALDKKTLRLNGSFDYLLAGKDVDHIVAPTSAALAAARPLGRHQELGMRQWSAEGDA